MTIVPVYVGLEYHSDTIRVCVMDADVETIINKNVVNNPGAVRDLVRICGNIVRGVAIAARSLSESLTTGTMPPLRDIWRISLID